MPFRFNRREFMVASAASLGATGLMVLPSFARSPNEKLNIAVIGVGGRGGANLDGVGGENIVALCDVDKNNLAAAAAKHPRAKTFADFRRMLSEMDQQIDAVVVSTPDHTHAPAGVMAMKMGKHCYCEKPLTHCVYEARLMAELATKNKLVTQMGTQIHAGDNYRRVVELIGSGTIGPVREVHVWSAASYVGGDRPSDTPPVPAHLDWDLWLGPAAYRPYHPVYVPGRWRGWKDFGTGGLGDFFCHYADLAFWALKLRHPTSVAAEGPPPHPESCPPWLIVRYEFPARQQLPPVKLTWYDGGRRPSLPGVALPDWRSAVLFVGAEGMLLADYERRMLLPEEKWKDFQPPEPTIPASIGHHAEWIAACKSGGPTTCNFDYSGPLTEAALLGVVSHRLGRKLAWDAARLRARGCPEADVLIKKPYRQGWSV
jgi:predicted dehydrogenase